MDPFGVNNTQNNSYYDLANKILNGSFSNSLSEQPPMYNQRNYGTQNYGNVNVSNFADMFTPNAFVKLNGKNIPINDALSEISSNWFTTREIPWYHEDGTQGGILTKDSLMKQYSTPLFQGLGAASGLWQAYNAWNYNNMLRDQMDYQKELSNRNLANQAKMVNNAIDSSYNIMLGMTDTMTPEQKQKARDYSKTRYIDGSPVG